MPSHPGGWRRLKFRGHSISEPLQWLGQIRVISYEGGLFRGAEAMMRSNAAAGSRVDQAPITQIGRWRNARQKPRCLFGLVGGFGAGLGGNNSGGYNHSDKGQGDQEVMHGFRSPCAARGEPVHMKIIVQNRKRLNTTKTLSSGRHVVLGVTRRWYFGRFESKKRRNKHGIARGLSRYNMMIMKVLLKIIRLSACCARSAWRPVSGFAI